MLTRTANGKTNTMTIDLGTFAAIAIPTVLGIVWLVRLEGRINVTDAQFEDIIRRLARIEAKQDELR